MTRHTERLLLSSLSAILFLGYAGVTSAAQPDRILRRVDAHRTRVISGSIHPSARAGIDRGAIDPATRLNTVTVFFKPSASQQAALDSLLADQQNPSSPLYHQWLTPEEYGDRFGLSAGDAGKVADWIRASGLSVETLARGRNWISFSGTAAQVGAALRTSFHRIQSGNETHFANATEVSVPEAFADVVDGFLGLDDYDLKPLARTVRGVSPLYNSGTKHYLAPEDMAKIYNIAPLYDAGIDGTGQSIAVVGASAVAVSDIRAFRTRFNLPANDPKMVLYGGTDPGYNDNQIEGNLDLEWAGAVAPKATLYYVYGASALTAIVASVNLNVAPIISVSYGGCETGFRPSFYRAVAQQGNAQGITILNSSGDAGAAGCDRQDNEPLATRGRMVSFPAALPEVTGVGGTQFVEGTGTYWGTKNSANGGSALSYIPEAAWNESDMYGLASSGGGASTYYAKPSWQNGPGVPADSVRHVPDLSLTAAGHDAYLITYSGSLGAVAGTSASAPSLAGVVALLNQYQVANGFQKRSGMGNINPQLYRLAQAVPNAFHDVVAGDNIVPCAIGTPDCLTGSYGYQAVAGYDEATGLGSIDANTLITQWNTKTSSVEVNLFVNVSRATLNDTIGVTASVAPLQGSAVPTGTVEFSLTNGSNAIPLGSVPLFTRGGKQVADLFFPAYQLGTGTMLVTAQYSGDVAFSSGGAQKTVQVTAPTGAAGIVPSAPNTVWPNLADAQGLTWQTLITLREVAGVPALVTGFTIDGQAQTLADYFPSAQIPGNGTTPVYVTFRNLAAPVIKTFGFTGTDVNGKAWSRQVAVNYMPYVLTPAFNVTAVPQVVTRNASADPGCQWPVELRIDELGGYRDSIAFLYAGGLDLTDKVAKIFGTTRLDAWGSLKGTICYGGVTPPASGIIEVDLASGLAQTVTVSFAAAPATPAKLTPTPAAVSLAAKDAKTPAQATLSLGLPDQNQPWTISVFPANRTAGWLSLSQYSGTGPAQLLVTASGAGYAPGAYRANLVIQAANATPQTVTVPVMFVLGPSDSGISITSVGDSVSFRPFASPGQLLTVFGTKLAAAAKTAAGIPLAFSLGGVTATVNGVAAPLLYVGPDQVNIQVPYEVGAGTAVVGINNGGQVAGFQFELVPAAPAVLSDGSGNLTPKATVQQGGYATLYLTGAGEVSPTIDTGFAPASTTAASALPKPLLAVSVTVGGTPVFLQFVGNAAGMIGATQVNFIVPASVPVGTQDVVVTVNGVSSVPVKLAVTAAGS